MRQAFALLDVKQTGKISADHLRLLLRGLGCVWSEQNMADAFKKAHVQGRAPRACLPRAGGLYWSMHARAAHHLISITGGTRSGRETLPRPRPAFRTSRRNRHV